MGAIADLTRAVTLREDFADAYQLRAEILLKMQQGTEALEDIQKVIELNPEEDMAYLLKGRIHAMMGEIEQADADFHQVLELNPFNEEATLLIGRLLIPKTSWMKRSPFSMKPLKMLRIKESSTRKEGEPKT